MIRVRDHIATLALVLGLLVLWEVSGQLRWVADGTLPPLSGILTRLSNEWREYWPHVIATLRSASLGFVFGNIVAILAAVCFCLWPLTERLFRGINIAAFTVPPIAVAPVLVIALDGDVARITLAALLGGCNPPTQVRLTSSVPMAEMISSSCGFCDYAAHCHLS